MINFGRRVAVLLYHHVGPVRDEACSGLTVLPEAFARQISTLAAMGYVTIAPSDWVGYVKEEWDLPKNSLIITFDDAYEDLVAHAFPVLSRHGFSATVFVPTGLIGETIQCNPDVRAAKMRIMTAEQIADAAAAGIDFGAHSRSHADLEKLETSEVVNEITGSRDDLAAIIGRDVTAFAYPYGRTTPTAMKLAGDLFPACFVIENGLNDRDTPLNALRRTMVQHGDSVADVLLRARFGASVLERIRTAAREIIGPRHRSIEA
jgi:peptidoglycan/xylan/chitin deacetylase (PgdA/CDA1 family)